MVTGRLRKEGERYIAIVEVPGEVVARLHLHDGQAIAFESMRPMHTGDRSADGLLTAVDAQGSDADDQYPLVTARVETLVQEDDEEDRPTEQALAATLRLLKEAHSLVAFPRASAATTVERGIHVYWKRPDRTLKLSMPAQNDDSGFIYHQDGQEHAAERHVTAQALADWLRWFNTA